LIVQCQITTDQSVFFAASQKPSRWQGLARLDRRGQDARDESAWPSGATAIAKALGIDRASGYRVL